MDSSPDPADDKVAFDLAPASARIISRAIDLVMLLAVATVIAIVLGAMGVLDVEELREQSEDESNRVAVALLLGAGFLYEVPLSAWKGKTLGKTISRSKLISAAEDRAPGPGASLIRVAVWLTPIFLLPGVGFIITVAVFGWAFFDAKSQGLHDKLAGTYVVVDDPRSV